MSNVITLKAADRVARKAWAAAQTTEEFHAYVMSTYSGLSRQRLLNVWWRLEKGV